MKDISDNLFLTKITWSCKDEEVATQAKAMLNVILCFEHAFLS